MPIELDDVCRNKAAIIERAIRRALEEYHRNPGLTDFTHIDAMTLNIERFCQAAIDLAMHLVAREHLGMPQTSADAFKLLLKGNLISENIARSMIAMVGFRNVAIHEYQEMEMAVLRSIGESKWNDVVAYCKELGLQIRP
jgi:uncharacterized protein YutE (UPF0331/DUF86 family)